MDLLESRVQAVDRDSDDDVAMRNQPKDRNVDEIDFIVLAGGSLVAIIKLLLKSRIRMRKQLKRRRFRRKPSLSFPLRQNVTFQSITSVYTERGFKRAFRRDKAVFTK